MAIATLAEKLLSVEDYLLIDDGSQPTELVRGRIVEMPPTKMGHGVICAIIAKLLGNYLDQHKSGRVVTNDAGVLTHRNPDTLRGADVAYYSFQRVPANVDLFESYPAAPPEIVVEVKSPGNSWPDITEKVAEYLHVGVDVVCVIDPEERVAVIQTTDAPPRTLTSEQTLEFPKILPGLQLKIADLLS